MGFLDFFKITQFKEQIASLEAQNRQLTQSLEEANSTLKTWGVYTVEEIQSQIKEKSEHLHNLTEDFNNSNEKYEKLLSKLQTASNKLVKSRELYRAIEHSMQAYLDLQPTEAQVKLSSSDSDTLDEYAPSVYLKLHCMDMKDLRKEYRTNDKLITNVLNKYSSRYTTKANKSIYQLMVIALRAELQNILCNLKFEKLDVSVDAVKAMTAKYLKIAGDGNQQIAGTLAKFIGEIEYLFINAVKIEYNYYVKKEQARQEQLVLREQMRQEAAEKKALEDERKKIEKEESKYNTEINRITEQLKEASASELAKLQARIEELKAQLSTVSAKKEEIANLQNGKAGTVYVISNLGSFGENVFKIGMTRRLEPQDRINELGNASVPFKFDVHSFIFSNDAVHLEKKLHSILNTKRVNKVNSHKEFFNTTIDELEKLVTEIAPTAEFNRTMVAEEYRQSLSSTENYTTDNHIVDNNAEDNKFPNNSASPKSIPTSSAPTELLCTKWGTYEMPSPYYIVLTKGPRNNLKIVDQTYS